MTNESTNTIYVELAMTMPTPEARRVEVETRAEGFITEDQGFGEPLFFATENTLNMSIQMHGDEPLEAAGEAIDIMLTELTAYDVDDILIQEPYSIKITDSDLMVENLMGSAYDKPDAFADEDDDKAGATA